MYLAHVTLLFVLCMISEQTTFDKSGQGVTDITVHTIPGTTTYFRFRSNSISFVPANYFINLPSLDKIGLHYNVITDIADAAFSQVPTVTSIKLYYNQLTVIREMMFSGLPNLATLRLSRNQIYLIEPGSFKGNTVLTYLSLGDNSLETVSQSIFDPNNHPTSLYNFKMYDNPLRCDNTLCWLKQLDTTWITVNLDVVSDTGCSGPTALAGRKWDTLTEMELCLIQGKCLT